MHSVSERAPFSEAGECRHRVVIIGAGFGGLAAARALRGAQVEVTVIDRTNHHLFQPLLYQVATGILSEGDIAPPTRDVLRHQSNVRVLLGNVTDINLRTRELVVESVDQRFCVPYDSLIVAAGASQSYFGQDQFALYAPGMKTIDDALELRGRIFGALEMAELERDGERRGALLTFAIVGGGPTGVEVAGQIAELTRRSLKGNYRAFDPTAARVLLLDASDAVLASFPEPLQRRAHSDLQRLGVEVRLGIRVTGIDARGLDFEDRDGSTGRIEAQTKIWAAGVQASPLGRILAEQSGAVVDHAGRVGVLADCTLPGYPEVFVIGDLMGLNHLPGVAEVAMQSGHYAAKTIVRRIKGEDDHRPFRYQDLGTLATISRFRAVGYLGRMHVSGFVGWLIWLFVHLMFLTGFKNRIATLLSWLVSFLGRAQRQRTITEQQVFARARTLGRAEATPRRP